MEAKAWKNGRSADPNCTFGIRVGKLNRRLHFDGLKTADVEIDGVIHSFPLSKGFWRNCPEIRDKQGTRAIRNWLQKNLSLTWAKGNPPRLNLVPLGGNQFRLKA
jgi:hypothetical protein